MPGVMRRQSISKQKKPGSPGFIKTPTDPTRKRRDEEVAGRKPTTPVKKRGR